MISKTDNKEVKSQNTDKYVKVLEKLSASAKAFDKLTFDEKIKIFLNKN